MKATFEFKCRRCGLIVKGPSGNASLLFQILMEVVLVGQSPYVAGVNDEPLAPRLIEAHQCEDKGYGVTDLIGYRVIEQ